MFHDPKNIALIFNLNKMIGFDICLRAKGKLFILHLTEILLNYSIIR